MSTAAVVRLMTRMDSVRVPVHPFRTSVTAQAFIFTEKKVMSKYTFFICFQREMLIMSTILFVWLVADS
jgi:hypothetical protein